MEGTGKLKTLVKVSAFMSHVLEKLSTNRPPCFPIYCQSRKQNGGKRSRSTNLSGAIRREIFVEN